MIWPELDASDSKKAKRSLLTVASATLLFATISFNSNELSVLGLSVEVSQPKVVRVGQIVTAILLSIFVLKEIPNSLRKLGNASLSRLETKQHLESDEFSSWHGPGQNDYDDNPEGEKKALDDKHDRQKRKLNTIYAKLVTASTVFAVIVVDYAVPITLGTITVINPYCLEIHVSSLTEQDRSSHIASGEEIEIDAEEQEIGSSEPQLFK